MRGKSVRIFDGFFSLHYELLSIALEEKNDYLMLLLGLTLDLETNSLESVAAFLDIPRSSSI